MAIGTHEEDIESFAVLPCFVTRIKAIYGDRRQKRWELNSVVSPNQVARRHMF